MTSLNIAALSREDLRAELQQLAGTCFDAASLIEAAGERLPGVCVSIIYCGPMYMGMAISPYHPAVLAF